MVPRARLELAHLAAADFESAASTDSATGASGGRIISESLARFKQLGAREGARERGSDQRGRAAFRVGRLPVQVRQDRTHQAAGEIAALWQAERIQLYSHRFGQVVADGVAIDEAFQVAETARPPRRLIGFGAGGEVAFGRQAVRAEFLAGIGVGREDEE